MVHNCFKPCDELNSLACSNFKIKAEIFYLFYKIYRNLKNMRGCYICSLHYIYIYIYRERERERECTTFDKEHKVEVVHTSFNKH